MHDIRAIREAPDAFDRAMERRGLEPQSEAILKLDVARREAQTELQQLQSRRNEASREIGQIKKQGGDAQPLIDEVSNIKERMATLEGEERIAAEALRVLLGGLPNVPDDDVPAGADESDNVELRRHGEASRINSAQEHHELGEALGLMDFATAAKMSGSRFVLLRGALARLERAIGQFMIDLHVNEHGYTEVSPPLMVRDEAMFGTGQLPKFAEESFRTTNDLWLIPTSEVSMTNFVAGDIVATEDLPYRYTALTPCFRAEAGAAGRDTHGMIRQHQFYKVELVSITEPGRSEEELERMTGCAETVLQKLGLAYRVMTLSTGDLGFAAHKTYDIEVWLPGQNAFREISSCSNTGDFQARRMNARCRAQGQKETRFVHTLNGSGVAVGRALIAVLETYQQADGSITVPEVLRPYMGGQSVIQAA